MLMTLSMLAVCLDALTVSAANATPSKDLKAFYKSKGHLSDEELYSNGMRCISESKPDSALAYYSMALGRLNTSLKGADSEMLGPIYNNMGYIYLYEYNDYVQAYTYFLQALEAQDQANDAELKPYILLNIGNVYASFNDQPSAINYYRKAFESITDLKSQSDICSVIVLNLFPDAYMENGAEGLEKDVRRFLSMKGGEGSLYEVARIVAEGIVCSIKSDDDEAFVKFMAALKKAESTESIDKRIRWSIAVMTAEAAKRAGKPGMSAGLLKSVLMESQINGMLDMASVASYNLADCFRVMNMTDSANRYRLLNLDIRDSLAGMGSYGKIRDMHSIYEVKNANDEIQILTIKDKNKTDMLVTVCIAMSLLAVLFVVIAIKNKKLRSRNESLFEQTQRLLMEDRTDRQEPAVSNFKGDSAEEENQKAAETDEPDQEEPKTQRLPMNDEMRRRLESAIRDIMASDEICASDFSLDSLAALVNSKARYVSGVINEQFGMGFNQMLSERRIQRACGMLASPEYDHLTIQSIGENLGFKSRSNFGALFKKYTGLTPGEYHSIAVRKRKESD